MTDYTIEAENLELDGYTAVNHSQGSGGGFIQTWGEGTASIVFEGVPGTYTINLAVFDESDGQSSIELVVNGQSVGTVTLDVDEGGNYVYGTQQTVTFEGVQIQPGDTIELVGTRDGGEPARIDTVNMSMTSSEIDGQEPVTLLQESFSNNFFNNVENSDLWIGNGLVGTNGAWDGELVMRQIDMTGYENATLTIDACLGGCGNFEAAGQWADFLEVQLVAEDGTIHVLDRFSGDGRTLTGSESGQTITEAEDTLSWDLPEGIGNFQVRIVSDISACNEVVFLDDVRVVAEPVVEPVEPPAPAIELADDAYVVGETEDAVGNILDNDPSNDGGLEVTTVTFAGVEFSAGDSFEVTTAAGRTGTVTVEADGSFTFDGGDNFIEMAAGETDSFVLDYTATLPGVTTSGTRVIDFEGLSAGDVISDQISGVTISATRRNDTDGVNDAMIFDTFNPTGGDEDLATTTQGNVLIISEDNDSSDPDDNAGGGVVNFDFDNPEEIQQITFLDTEEGGATITLTLADGSTQTMTGPQTLNGHVGTFVVGVANVVSMEISMIGSGAIDDIVLTDTVDIDGPSADAQVTVTINGENDLSDEGETSTVGEDAGVVALTNVMDNTIDPELASDTTVVAVAGEATSVGTSVAGSNGGVFTINEDGTATFDTAEQFEALAAGEETTTSVTYTVRDSAGDTVTSTYTVTVVGVNDLSDEGESTTVGEDAGPVALTNVMDNTVDPETTSTTTVTAVSGDETKVGNTVAGSNGGVFTINEDGTATFDTAEQFEALARDEETTTSVTYTVTDSAGDTVTSTYTVTVVGENDLADEDETVTIEEEDAGVVELTNALANTHDPETDSSVTITGVGGDAAGVGVRVTGSNGGEFIIAEDGSVTFDTLGDFVDLNEGETRTTTITYDVTDSAGDTVTSTYTVNVEGQNPPPPPADTNEAVNFAGNIVTSGPGTNAIAIVIDTSSTALASVAGATVGDMNGDARVGTVVDVFLNQVVHMVGGMAADQELALIPAGQDEAGPALVVTAAQIVDAAAGTASIGGLLEQAIADWKNGLYDSLEENGTTFTDFVQIALSTPSQELRDLFSPITDDALDNTIDLDKGLIAAENYLNSAGGDSNEVLVLTSTDNFDIATFTDVSDPTATVDRLTDDAGLDADIDVVLIENGYFAEVASLDAIDSDMMTDVITASETFGLDQLIDPAPDQTYADVIDVTINGETLAVADADPAADGFQLDIGGFDIEIGSAPTVFVGLDTAGDGVADTQVDVSGDLVRDGATFTFDLDLSEQDQILFG